MNKFVATKTAPIASSQQRPLADFSASPRVLVIASIAAIIALASVAAGVALLDLIRVVTNLVYFGRFSFAQSWLGALRLGPWSVFIPVAGAFVVGLMARYGSEKIRGHGIPEAIEAILLGRSRLDAKVALLKPLSSAIAIGTGGPFGAEGPIIMTGGALGSLIAQMLPVSDAERKTLLVSGAAAGMTTVFGTPIAAVMLGVELLLFEWRPRSFIPVAAAAIIAAVARHALHMPSPLFPFAGNVAISPLALLSWVAVGLIVGLLSCGLSRLVYGWEDAFSKLPIHWMWWPMFGGLVVGLGGLIAPQALGVGYENIAAMLKGHVPAQGALVLLAVKALIWSAALGSGTSGGVLAPLLIMGGAAGAVLSGLLPFGAPGFWPLLGMAACMSGAMRVPLTATFFAVEVTGNIHVLLPLLTACATAYGVTVLLMRRSILTEKVTRRGHHIVCEYDVDSLALARVGEIMNRSVETVPAAMTLGEATRFLAASTHPSLPVLNGADRVIGMIDSPTILRWRHEGRAPETILTELLGSADVPHAYADEGMESLIARLSAANLSYLPVLSREDARLVGYVGWKDILAARPGLGAEERQRFAFLRRGSPSACEARSQ